MPLGASHSCSSMIPVSAASMSSRAMSSACAARLHNAGTCGTGPRCRFGAGHRTACSPALSRSDSCMDRASRRDRSAIENQPFSDYKVRNPAEPCDGLVSSVERNTGHHARARRSEAQQPRMPANSCESSSDDEQPDLRRGCDGMRPRSQPPRAPPADRTRYARPIRPVRPSRAPAQLLPRG